MALNECPEQIFLYGGRASDLGTTIAQGAVYSLSLPAFHWQRHSTTPEQGRYAHTCNIADPAGRNRQMLVVGGFLATAESGTVNDPVSGNIYPSPPDPWPHGVGVFYLGSLEWKDGFDAEAGDYVTPGAIRQYNERNGRAPEAGWTEEGVEAWFQAVTTVTSSPAPGPGDAQHHSLTNTGAIAGGVVGGLAALAFLAGAVWLLRLRRRQRRQRSRLLQDYGEPEFELHMAELAKLKRERAELGGRARAAELAAERDRQELAAERDCQELPGSGR